MVQPELIVTKIQKDLRCLVNLVVIFYTIIIYNRRAISVFDHNKL